MITWTSASQHYNDRMWKSHCGQINRTWHYKVLRKICWRYLTCYQENRSCVLNRFNSFNYNLKFTIDTFENCVPHFVDIEICLNVLGIYHKHTQTGQYVNFDSFTLWKWKASRIHSLVIRAKHFVKRIILIRKSNLLRIMQHGMVTRSILSIQL